MAFLHPRLPHVSQNKLCSILVCHFSLSYHGNALRFVEAVTVTQALHKSAVIWAPFLFADQTISTMHDICSVTSRKSKQSAYQAGSTSLSVFGQLLLHFASALPLSLWKPTLPLQISHASRPCMVQVRQTQFLSCHAIVMPRICFISSDEAFLSFPRFDLFVPFSNKLSTLDSFPPGLSNGLGFCQSPGCVYTFVFTLRECPVSIVILLKIELRDPSGTSPSLGLLIMRRQSSNGSSRSVSAERYSGFISHDAICSRTGEDSFVVRTVYLPGCWVCLKPLKNSGRWLQGRMTATGSCPHHLGNLLP